jgi:hypothetical protein
MDAISTACVLLLVRSLSRIILPIVANPPQITLVQVVVQFALMQPLAGLARPQFELSAAHFVILTVP